MTAASNPAAELTEAEVESLFAEHFIRNEGGYFACDCGHWSRDTINPNAWALHIANVALAARLAAGEAATDEAGAVRRAIRQVQAGLPSTSAEDWHTLEGREAHGFRRGVAAVADAIAAALKVAVGAASDAGLPVESVVFFVELDEDGSADQYDTEQEAREARDTHGGYRVLKCVTYDLDAAPAPTEDAAVVEVEGYVPPALSRAADTAAEEPRTEAQGGLLLESLRDAQQARCAYGTREGDGRTCDCKFGAPTFGYKGEMTGCPEIRQAIWALDPTRQTLADRLSRADEEAGS